MWTSGQWMTERTGGSDVSQSETIAKQDGDTWRLYGTKWFTSATTSQMALTLARPEGNPEGSRGLALFLVELRDASGRLRNIYVNRLKDKLGTRKVPTAELTLDGTPAELVAGREDGIRNIAPMLNVTRTWNSVAACALARRGLALAADFAGKRVAFGAPLAEKPLHVDTLAGLEAEFLGALHLTFFVAELMGREEAGKASAEQQSLLRLLTPVAKLLTGRQAVQILSEAIESFGGAGYVEDTGLPLLLRDAQVLPIWEGTTNVLSLETLRALQAVGGLAVLKREIGIWLREVREPNLVRISAQVERTLEQAESWLAAAKGDALEAGARRFAMTLGRVAELALLAQHAQWSFAVEKDRRAAAAARRLAAHGVNQLADMDPEDARRLAG
jgi:alkylation response protein AidB-like acyl-CoA dehydrogenase